jgi:hypothetical protein
MSCKRWELISKEKCENNIPPFLNSSQPLLPTGRQAFAKEGVKSVPLWKKGSCEKIQVSKPGWGDVGKNVER